MSNELRAKIIARAAQFEIKGEDNSEKMVIEILSFLRGVLKRLSIVSSAGTGDIKILKPSEYEKMIAKLGIFFLRKSTI